jgi:hypothetical protein
VASALSSTVVEREKLGMLGAEPAPIIRDSGPV